MRVIQPPRVPVQPQPTRRLILLAGIVISMLLSISSILVSHFFRAIYLRPEALELDTGLTVLTLGAGDAGNRRAVVVSTGGPRLSLVQHHRND